MGTTVRYKGPRDEVDVPEAGIVVERLKPVEVDSELAKRLLLQEDNWERPPQPKQRKPARTPKPAAKAPELPKPAPESDTGRITQPAPASQPAVTGKDGE